MICMLSTAEDVITFVIRSDLYFLGFFRYGLVSFNDFLDILNFTILLDCYSCDPFSAVFRGVVRGVASAQFTIL